MIIAAVSQDESKDFDRAAGKSSEDFMMVCVVPRYLVQKYMFKEHTRNKQKTLNDYHKYFNMNRT